MITKVKYEKVQGNLYVQLMIKIEEPNGECTYALSIAKKPTEYEVYFDIIPSISVQTASITDFLKNQKVREAIAKCFPHHIERANQAIRSCDNWLQVKIDEQLNNPPNHSTPRELIIGR